MDWKKRVVLFLGGQTITLFGSMLVQFAISWHITLTTQSGMLLAISVVCGFLPQMFISLFAGVWADRYSRKAMIIIADGSIALCTAVLALAFSFGYTELWLLFVISVVRSLGSGVQTPAVGAFLPEFVPQDRLMRVNGINAGIMGIMMVISPVLAGGLYEMLGIGSIFWVDVITAVIGIGLLIVLKTMPREKTANAAQSIISDMASGLRYVIRTRWLRQFFGFYLFYSLMFGPVVFLTPLMVARSFGDEPWRLVVHEMVFAIGNALGGLLIGMISRRVRNCIHLLIGATLAFGFTTFVMGFSPNFWFYLGVMLPMGLTMPFINTCSMTVLQTRADAQMMGRVFGLTSIIMSTTMPLSMAIFGPLADFMSVEIQLVITGMIMVLLSVLMFRFKEVVAMGEPVADPIEEVME